MTQATKPRSLETLLGAALLNDPIRNKGTAFTPDERREFGLEGLLPRSVDSLE